MTQHSKFGEAYSAADLYESTKAIMKLVSDGFLLKREDRSQKDLYIQLIDYSVLVAFREPSPGEVPSIVAEDEAVYGASGNIFKIVNQLEIVGHEKRIPDGVLPHRDSLLPKLISGEFTVPAA